MRIVLSGGGTGGHITPILAVVKALEQTRPKPTLYWLGEKNPLTDEMLTLSNLKLNYIMAGKFRRYHNEAWWRQLKDIKSMLLNLRDVFKLAIGIFQSLYRLIKIKPQAVFIKGGYVGLPVGIAAWILGKPIIIHESDARAGLTNRLLARVARIITTGWPTQYYPRWRGRNVIFTGNPMRAELLHAKLSQARAFFKLEQDLPTLLVVGGSSGARRINQAVVDQLSKWLRTFQIIHISGGRDWQQLSQQVTEMTLAHRQRYHAYDFLAEEMGLAYAAADVVICRAGMNTITELANLKKPAVVIPHPQLTGAHQLRNAEVLETEQAAIVLQQDRLEEDLYDAAVELLRSKDQQALLKKGLAKLARPQAAEKLAELTVSLA
ncbi:UDP-N-acetylglucosamine--N-acetylmuramyl-(pentapeptide) pyrophosphoryl-undecaprenol N-acetylglucosamine transferase [Candidatus Microgenomates bacterium]|nr:UDP-N-acetylglucosamine--N-acetylmuramyl-(pentapeptide) pyrophosphoryl-undecaprenol N-acetylglucosamine transferase [Candidatus Microgenomates bacterium]